MARAVRTSGPSVGMATALVFLGLLSVAGWAFGIIYFVQVDSARTELEQAQADLAEVAGNQDLANREVTQMLSQPGTVVSQLIEEIETLRRLINADPEQTSESLQSLLASLPVDPDGTTLEPGIPLTQAIGNLVETVKQLRAEKAQRDARIAELGGQITTLESQIASTDRSHEQKVEELRQQLTRLQNDRERMEREMVAQRQVLEQRITELQGEKRETSQDMGQQIATLEGRVLDLEGQLRAQQRRNPAPPVPSSADKIDAHVLSVLPDQNLVYLNIGSNDQATLGLTFELFDSSTGVPDNEDARGKASVEIIELRPTTSVARIVRKTPRAPVVQEGDAAVSLVFDRNRQYRFFVFGEFDIDDVGQATAADRRRIESIVTRWGGRLSETLTPDVDFAVFGVEPQLPEQPAADAPLERHEEYARQLEVFRQYTQMRGEAQSMRIPVLNENRFLSLVGYYVR